MRKKKKKWKDMTDEERRNWRPITFDETGKPTIWWYLLALPAIIILCTLHFLLCSFLTIFVHPPRKRYKIYEYYARWGWGARPEVEIGLNYPEEECGNGTGSS
jgi:hypothetical protein